jgi:hypothetical protein
MEWPSQILQLLNPPIYLSMGMKKQYRQIKAQKSKTEYLTMQR